jgi:hypothetical protein
MFCDDFLPVAVSKEIQLLTLSPSVDTKSFGIGAVQFIQSLLGVNRQSFGISLLFSKSISGLSFGHWRA